MICLTGDVHHKSLHTNDQRFIAELRDTEVKITRRYLELLERHDAKVTLYICGRCFTEEGEDLHPTATHPLVEVGGHGFRARQPRWLFDWYGERTANWNGPKWFQAWDIRKCLRACQEGTDYRPVSWRGHSYKVDPNTYPLLSKYGVKLVSDEIRANNLWPERIGWGLISHPMNVIPDHDHLYHAHRTPEYVERMNQIGYGADEFGSVSYGVEEWGRLVVEQVERIEGVSGISTILAHPLCMYLADGFKTLDRLLKALRGTEMIWAREIPDLIDAAPPQGRLSGLEQYRPQPRE